MFRYNTYCCFGDISEEQQKIYEAVKKSNEESIKEVKPVVRCIILDKVSRDIIKKVGYTR